MKFKSSKQRKAVMAKLITRPLTYGADVVRVKVIRKYKKPTKSDYVEALSKYYSKHPKSFKRDIKQAMKFK